MESTGDRCDDNIMWYWSLDHERTKRCNQPWKPYVWFPVFPSLEGLSLCFVAHNIQPISRNALMVLFFSVVVISCFLKWCQCPTYMYIFHGSFTCTGTIAWLPRASAINMMLWVKSVGNWKKITNTNSMHDSSDTLKLVQFHIYLSQDWEKYSIFRYIWNFWHGKYIATMGFGYNLHAMQ